MANRFDLSFRTFAVKILPPNMVTNYIANYLGSLLQPLKELAQTMSTFNDNQLKRARFNGQIIVLRAALEDITGISGIQIETNDVVEPLYLFQQAEADPVYFYQEAESTPVYMYQEAEVGVGYSFTVKVPVASYNADVDAQIRGEIAIFGLVGKNFNITTI